MNICSIKTLDQGRRRKSITILSAGAAGLAAAYELEKLGQKYVSLKTVTNVVGTSMDIQI